MVMARPRVVLPGAIGAFVKEVACIAFSASGGGHREPAVALALLHARRSRSFENGGPFFLIDDRMLRLALLALAIAFALIA